ncbi:PadR family transcriptional regulator [Acidianus sp. RZ1]|uniref:PadR family transcriptional regulator n=1 Tax=Acidianus sp. RZ1 TaxID=1540082 RepID=UPI0035304C59
MIKTIEKKFSGLYKPSPGSVYPVIKSLVSEGLVKVDNVNGKKIYVITDSGRSTYKEMKEEAKNFFSQNNQYRKLTRSLFDIGLTLYNYKEILKDEKTFNEVMTVIDDCRKKIEAVLEGVKKE